MIGQITGLFGVKGWVKVYSHTRPRAAILGYRQWLVRLQEGWREVPVCAGHSQGKGIVAQLEGYNDRDAAQALIGADIAVKFSHLPALKKNEYYWAQLEGLRVISRAQQELGIVSHLFETGANDVMVVQGEREHLIPFVRDVILKVDLAAGTIEVDWEDT